MSGEDVYDVAAWCHICQEPHTDCEPIGDVDLECLTCEHWDHEHFKWFGRCGHEGCRCQKMVTGL